MKKTNHKRYIILLFLCFQALSAAVRPVTVQNLPESLQSEIEALDSMVHTLFKLKKRVWNGAELIICSAKLQHPKLELRNSKMTLTTVSGRSVLNDPENARALLSALLLSTGALDLNPHAECAVPGWLCTGILERFRAFRNEERFLKGVRSFPAVEFMMVSAASPELTKIFSLPEKLSGEAAVWYAQYSRLVLELAIKNKLLPHYALRIIQTQDYSEENSQLQAKLTETLSAPKMHITGNSPESVIWNYYHPAPAELKLKQLATLLKWQLPQLDEKDKPTDKMVEIPLSELHLHLKERPDAEEQRRKAAEAVQKYDFGCTQIETQMLRQIHQQIVNAAKNTREQTILLGKMFDIFRKTLYKREQIERLLYVSEQRYCSTAKRHKQLLQITPGFGTASAEQQKFLLDTENIYGF